MPLADDRDPASRQQSNPSNPGIRNPYGSGTWNMGGRPFSTPNMGTNSYGWGDNNYGSGQAALAYAAAQRTLADVYQKSHTTNADGTNALTGAMPTVRGGGDDFTDYGRGDRANSEFSDYPYRPPVSSASLGGPSAPAPNAPRARVPLKLPSSRLNRLSTNSRLRRL